MKNMSFYLLFSVLLFACQDEEPNLENLQVPTNLTVSTTVSTDGSGVVEFNASADNAITYHYYFGNGEGENAVVSQSGRASNTYKRTGLNDYLVRVIAFAPGGLSSSIQTTVSVDVDFEVPAELVRNLTNNNAKTWYWKQSVGGHLGVGPLVDGSGAVVSDPIWYQATPNEKEGAGCLYEDEMTFIDNGDGTYSYTINNNGNTFFHVDEAAEALSIPTPGEDICGEFSTEGIKNVLFSTINSGVSPSTGVAMDIGNSGFLSYYLGSSSYEIMNITNTELLVRVIQEVNGEQRAWYHTFSNTRGETVDTTMVIDTEYTNLVWSDEFEEAGAPDASKWTYDIGRGNNGWGNNEAQYYTDREENVIIEDGSLKIKALKESFEDAEYTSARLKTQGLFGFTNGRVDVRAKLPIGGGTWPAIWTLGTNIETVGWPVCGEIDIMEHVGNVPNEVSCAIHNNSSFGNTVNVFKKEVANVQTEFHVYSVNWSPDQLTFLIDDEVYYIYNPEEKNNDNWPFTADQFIILNTAIGGTLGGSIDPEYSESTFEIDYVRVYQ